jgi:hypothetical protein
MTGTEALVAAGLVLSSAGTVDQIAGLGAVVAYAVAVFVLVPPVLRLALPRFVERVSPRTAHLLAATSFLVLLGAFVIVYPRVDSHVPGVGSDRDDALNVAARHLLHLQYPYSTPTYQGNFVSQLPGAVLLAVPFVEIGNSAYQTFFWLPVLYGTLYLVVRDARIAVAVLWLALAASPGALREVLNGGDLVANTAYVLVFALAVLWLPSVPRWPRFAAAAALGIALSSRPNVLLVLPLLAAVLWRREGRDTALLLCGVAAIVCAAVTLPFYAHSRSGFSPLLTAGKVQRLENVVPHAGALLLVAASALTVVLALRLRTSRASMFVALAVVEGALFAIATVFASIAAHGVDLGFLLLGYGLFALMPAIVALSLLAPCATPSAAFRSD